LPSKPTSRDAEAASRAAHLESDETRRWAIWIDVEGFSNLWSAGDLALRGLTELTDLVYRIGATCYPSEPDRLFAHQIGDGFFIASDFHEPSLDRCAAVAIVLMRCLSNVGCVARASLAEGDSADYSGCRPRSVRQAAEQVGSKNVISMGAGVMTLQSILGQGLINAVSLDKIAGTKGSILTVARSASHRLSPSFLTRPLAANPDVLAIDWIHSDIALVVEIAMRADLVLPDAAALERRLQSYIRKHDMNPSWVAPTLTYVGLA
jgi:hypothetical protein